MSKVCFVSYEIHPTVSGGCGVLLSNAAKVLLSQGHQIVFLLDLSEDDFRRFNEVDRLNLPHPENCWAYQVDTLTVGMPYTQKHFASLFEYNAYRFHLAASKVNLIEKPDLIEFFEYTGVAYHALCAKITGMDYANTHLAIRLHNSLELIDYQQPGEIHNFDRYIMYNLEHHALRLAETVLYPSRSYLEDAYRPYYEPWFGNSIESTPPLVDKPVANGIADHPNVILFYGRLVGIKGVDRFIDASILYLSNPENPRREFYLAGYDSKLPPGSKGTYQAYLRHKIPSQYQELFHFTGKLSWQELGDLLPRVLFSVIPSYSESFCYAAHELYEAGIPLILSDIPAFQDSFQNEQNALVFDGTIFDLASQMQRLSIDAELCQRIRHPYPVLKPPLGEFYTAVKRSSWIAPAGEIEFPSLLVCILCHQTERLAETIQSLRNSATGRFQVILAIPDPGGESKQVVTWFLGKNYSFKDEQGNPIYPTQIKTSAALLILQAGDVLSPNFIPTAVSTLTRQPQISFVGCWKQMITDKGVVPQFLAFDASPELLPFKLSSSSSRFIMRTPAEQLLIDLFDPRYGELGEIAYLWELDSESHCGIIIPEPLVTLHRQYEKFLDSNALDFLIIRDHSPWRKKRLARYLLSLMNRRTVLARNLRIQKGDVYEFMPAWLKNLIFWLGSTHLNRWVNRRTPWIKHAIRKAAGVLRIYSAE